MDFWTWLASPIGIEAQHAAIALVLAAAGYLSFLAHREATRNGELLNGHLQDHLLAAALRDATETPHSEPTVLSAPPSDATERPPAGEHLPPEA